MKIETKQESVRFFPAVPFILSLPFPLLISPPLQLRQRPNSVIASAANWQLLIRLVGLSPSNSFRFVSFARAAAAAVSLILPILASLLTAKKIKKLPTRNLTFSLFGEADSRTVENCFTALHFPLCNSERVRESAEEYSLSIANSWSRSTAAAVAAFADANSAPTSPYSPFSRPLRLQNPTDDKLNGRAYLLFTCVPLPLLVGESGVFCSVWCCLDIHLGWSQFFSLAPLLLIRLVGLSPSNSFRFVSFARAAAAASQYWRINQRNERERVCPRISSIFSRICCFHFISFRPFHSLIHSCIHSPLPPPSER